MGQLVWLGDVSGTGDVRSVPLRQADMFMGTSAAPSAAGLRGMKLDLPPGKELPVGGGSMAARSAGRGRALVGAVNCGRREMARQARPCPCYLLPLAFIVDSLVRFPHIPARPTAPPLLPQPVPSLPAVLPPTRPPDPNPQHPESLPAPLLPSPLCSSGPGPPSSPHLPPTCHRSALSSGFSPREERGLEPRAAPPAGPAASLLGCSLSAVRMVTTPPHMSILPTGLRGGTGSPTPNS